MKKVLLLALCIGTLAGCKKEETVQCPYGYLEPECNEAWADKYVGIWQSSTGVYLEINKESATRIRFDDRHFVNLTSLSELDVPNQTYQHQITGADIQVQGSGYYTPGRLTMNLRYVTIGQTIVQTEVYEP